MTSTQTVFIRQFNALAEALLPYTATLDDGFRYLTDAAPAHIVEPYRKMESVGYWNGWL